MTTLGKLILFVVLCLFIVAGFFVYNTTHTDGNMKIGVIAPLSDVFAKYGEEIRRGVSSVSFDGVEFVFEDEKCEPKTAISAFRKLVDFDNVSFVIGPACGSPQEVVATLLKDKKILSIVPSAASKNLFSSSGGNMFNMHYSLEDESSFLARKMFELGMKRVALVAYENAFSRTHADSFRKNYSGEIAHESWFADNGADVSSELLKIRAAQPDAIFVADAAFFFADGINKLRRLGVAAPIYSQYTTELPAMRDFVEGVIYSFPADLPNTGDGGIFHISKEAAEIMGEVVKKCSGKYDCVRDTIVSSGKFDENGVMKRPIRLKKIENGKAIEIE